MNEQNTWPNIVFFDGICVLCNRYIDFLVKKDKQKKLKFAAIQSGFFKEHFSGEKDDRELDSVILLKRGEIFTRSDAVLRILAELGFPYNLSCIFFMVPKPARDKAYDYVARNRFRWFGTRETCRVPDKSLEDRLIV